MSRTARDTRARREPVTLTIDALSHEGRGVARLEGKTVFVHGALPGETVSARIVRRRGRFDEAETLAVMVPAAQRVAPRCAHFGVCGGCTLQHLDERAQLAHKQGVLLELLEHQGGIVPDAVAAPVRGPQWGYRRKARLGVKQVPRKGGVIVGFRERAKPLVTDCRHCDTLDPRVGALLPELRTLLDGLSIPDRVPQLEVAMSDARAVLVLRHLAPLSDGDRQALAAFARAHDVEFQLQSGGPETVSALDGAAAEGLLSYRVGDLELCHEPLDFTQVNAAINAQMVSGALHRLELSPQLRAADLFCGIGNFTLPMARACAQVVGIEGAAPLIERARGNAGRNRLDGRTRFAVADLADADTVAALDLDGATRLLLDPPRAGALAVVEHLPLATIERLVYVSCHPLTLARDAAVLVRRGYRLRETGILDMFPHTAHVESMSLFERR